MASSQRPSNIRKVLISEAWIDRLALSSLLPLWEGEALCNQLIAREMESGVRMVSPSRGSRAAHKFFVTASEVAWRAR